MPQITMLTHPATPPAAVAWAEATAPRLATAVERRMGRIAPVTLAIARDPGQLDYLIETHSRAAAGIDPASRGGHSAHTPGGHAGWTGPHPGGGVVTVLLANTLTGRDGAVVLAHELIHCRQLTDPAVRAEAIAGIRHNLGIDELPNRVARQMNRHVDGREREAYRNEKRLAKEIRL